MLKSCPSSPLLLTPAPRRALAAAAAPDVEIVVPVYNEAAGLEQSVRRLHRFLPDGFPFTWRIVIADNASDRRHARDRAAARGDAAGRRHLRLERKGRGRALRAAWSASPATVVGYMDVDLSTDLRGLLPLVAPLMSGHCDLAIGTRLAHGSRVVRGPKRELISRSYNRSCARMLRARFSDAQCGFKAVRRDALDELLDDVADDGLVLRHRAARARPAPRPAHPRGAGRLGRRPRLARRHRPHGDRRPARRRAAARRRRRSRASWASACSARSPTRCSTCSCAPLLGARRRERRWRSRSPPSATPPPTAASRSACAAATACCATTCAARVVFVLTLALTSGALLVLHGLDPDPARAVELAVLIAASTDRDRHPLRRAAHAGSSPARAARRPTARARARGPLTRTGRSAMSTTALPRVARPVPAVALACVSTGCCSPCSRSPAPLPVEPDDQRLLERVLRRRRPGRQRELEGVVLRRARSRQLHHRRQAAAVALADGPLGPRARLLVVQRCCSRRRCARSPPSRCCTRRSGASFGAAAGLIAAAALAITPDRRSRSRASTTPTRCSSCCSCAPPTCSVRALESGRTQAPRVVRRARRPRPS